MTFNGRLRWGKGMSLINCGWGEKVWTEGPAWAGLLSHILHCLLVSSIKQLLSSRRFADNIFAFLSISSTTFQQRPFGNCWFIDSAHQWSTFVFRVRGWYIPSSLPHIFLFWSFLLFQKVSQSELWRQWRRSQETIVKPGGRVPVPPQGVAFL